MDRQELLSLVMEQVRATEVDTGQSRAWIEFMNTVRGEQNDVDLASMAKLAGWRQQRALQEHAGWVAISEMVKSLRRQEHTP